MINGKLNILEWFTSLDSLNNISYKNIIFFYAVIYDNNGVIDMILSQIMVTTDSVEKQKIKLKLMVDVMINFINYYDIEKNKNDMNKFYKKIITVSKEYMLNYKIDRGIDETVPYDIPEENYIEENYRILSKVYMINYSFEKAHREINNKDYIHACSTISYFYDKFDLYFP
jgi:hypothetical protein